MNERPPNEDDVDAQYRRASARDTSRPSESVRRAVLRHAAELAARRVNQDTVDLSRPSAAAPVKLDFRQPAANEVRWRPAAYGGLAAAALAGLLIAPHFLPTAAPPPPSGARAVKSEAAPAAAAPEASAPGASAPAAAALASAPGASAPAAAALASPSSRLDPHDKTASAIAASSRPFAGDSRLHENSQGIMGALPRPALPAPSAGLQAPAAPPPRAMASVEALAAAAPAHAPIDSATALRQAAQSGDTPRLKAILDQPVDVDARDSAGRTALMLAVIAGQAPAVDALLARGADPNVADSSGTTPLAAALAANQAQIIAALRRAGAH